MMKRILASFLTGVMLFACAAAASAEEPLNTEELQAVAEAEASQEETALGTFVFRPEEETVAEIPEPVTAVSPEAPAVESPAEEQPPVPTSPEASPESDEQPGPGDGLWESGSVRQEVKDENGRTLMTVTVSNVPGNVELVFREATDSEIDEYTGRLGFLAPLYQRAYTTNDFILAVSALVSYEDGSTETLDTFVSDEPMTFTVETADLNELWEGRDDEAVRGDHLLYSLPFGEYQRIGWYSIDDEAPAIRFETDTVAPVVLVRLGPGIDPEAAQETMTTVEEETAEQEPAEEQTTETVEEQTEESGENQTTEPAEEQTAEPVEDQPAEPAEGQTIEPADNQTTEPAETDNNIEEEPAPEPAGLQVKIAGLPESAEATWRELAEEEYTGLLPQLSAAFGGREVEVLSAVGIGVSEASADTIKTAVITIPGLGEPGPEVRLYRIWENNELEYLDCVCQEDTVRFSAYTFSPVILVRPASAVTTVTPTLTERTITGRADDEATVTITGLLPENAVARIIPVFLSEDQRSACFGDAAGSRLYVAYDISVLADGEEWEPEDGNTLSVAVTPPGQTVNTNAPMDLYHIQSSEGETSASKVEYAVEDGKSVSFETGGFSPFVFDGIRSFFGGLIPSAYAEEPTPVTALIPVSGNGTFTLTKPQNEADLFDDDTEKHKNDEYVASLFVNGSGEITLNYTAAGAYTYRLVGRNGDYARIYKVEVTVTQQDGVLNTPIVMIWDETGEKREKGELLKTVVTPVLRKSVSGPAPSPAEEYRFVLTAEGMTNPAGAEMTGTQPMPESAATDSATGKLTSAVVISGEGSASPGTITFTEPGT